MITDFSGNDAAGCLWRVFSGNSGTRNYVFGQRGRQFQGERGDVEDRAVVRKTFPLEPVKWIDW